MTQVTNTNIPSQIPLNSGSGSGVTTANNSVTTGIAGGAAALNMLQGNKVVAQSQLLRRPTLSTPAPSGSMQSSQRKAKAELSNLHVMGSEVEKEVAGLVQAHSGKERLSEIQKEKMLAWANDIDESAEYLNTLKGNNLDKEKNQKLLLSSMGHVKHEDIMASRDAKKQDALLNSKYGANLPERVKTLKAMGYNEGQIKMILLMSPSKGNSTLPMQSSKGAADKYLASMGFNKSQIAGLMSLLQGGKSLGLSSKESNILRNLLEKSGFSKGAIDVMLSTGIKSAMQKTAQNSKNFSSSEIEQLKSTAAELKSMASSTNPLIPESMDQMSMMFTVLALLHKMGNSQRESARLSRQIAYEGAQKMIEEQADEIRDGALDTLIAESVTGAVSIVGGLVSMYGGLKGAPKDADAAPPPGAANAKANANAGTSKAAAGAGKGKQQGAAGKTLQRNNAANNKNGIKNNKPQNKPTKNAEQNLKKADADNAETQANNKANDKKANINKRKQTKQEQDVVQEVQQNNRQNINKPGNNNTKPTGKMDPTNPRYNKSPGTLKSGKDIPSQRQLDMKQFKAGGGLKNSKGQNPANFKEFQQLKYGKGNYEKPNTQTNAPNRQNENLKQNEKSTSRNKNGANKNQQTDNNTDIGKIDKNAKKNQIVNQKQLDKAKQDIADTGSSNNPGSQKPSKSGSGNKDQGKGQNQKKQDLQKDESKRQQKKTDNKNDSKNQADMDEAQKSAAETNRNVTKFNALGQVISAFGTAGSAVMKYQAAEHSAREKEYQALQKAYENVAQSSGEMMTNFQDMVKNAMSKFEELERSRADTLKSMTRG